MINFPNDPIEFQNFLDDNGRGWQFANGYWQEVIVSFSIDLLRDVKTVFDTQSIVFVDTLGNEHSIDATVDFSLVLADNTVGDIAYTPYDLPFYTTDALYDGIDIIKYKPALNSLLYWDGINWVPDLKSYSTKDIVGYETDTAVDQDVMVYQGGEFLPTNITPYVQYQNSYDKQYVSEITNSGYDNINDFNVMHRHTMDTVSCTTDPNMVDLVNNRLICTDDGLYRIFWKWLITHYNPASHYYYKQNTFFKIHDIDDNELKSINCGHETVQSRSNYEMPQYHVRCANVELDLRVGDYITGYTSRKSFGGNTASRITGTLSMMKIAPLDPLPTPDPAFIGVIPINASTSTNANPITVDLEAGTYEIRPVYWDGVYSLSPWSTVLATGCDIYGENCTTGWRWGINYSTPEFGEIGWNPTGSYKEIPAQALQAAQAIPPRQFTITYAQTASFWFNDSNYTDNQGGSPFELWKVA